MYKLRYINPFCRINKADCSLVPKMTLPFLDAEREGLLNFFNSLYFFQIFGKRHGVYVENFYQNRSKLLGGGGGLKLLGARDLWEGYYPQVPLDKCSYSTKFVWSYI